MQNFNKHRLYCAFVFSSITLLGCYQTDNPANKTDETSPSSTTDTTTQTTTLQAQVVELPQQQDLTKGQSYLSIYPTIYDFSQHKKRSLTAVINLRNINSDKAVYITQADYYDTNGKKIHAYVSQPIVIQPMQTLEIVIERTNKPNGTGASFVFNWQKPKHAHSPLFEALMTSTLNQQGISFTTQAIQITN